MQDFIINSSVHFFLGLGVGAEQLRFVGGGGVVELAISKPLHPVVPPLP